MPRPTLAPLYVPDRRAADQSLMKQYLNWLFVKKGLYFRNYDDLWDWSVTDLEDFWGEHLAVFRCSEPHTLSAGTLQTPSGGYDWN